MSFRHYIAVGDSISIDLYPALDLQEREGLATPPPGLGAASLLYRNDDERWPEFEGCDLATRFPRLRALNLTANGATMTSTLASQVPRIPVGLDGPTLVTITAGGNDLISLLNLDVGRPATAAQGEAEEAVDRIAGTLDRIIEEVRGRLENPTVLLGTVYDPVGWFWRSGRRARPAACARLAGAIQRPRRISRRCSGRAADPDPGPLPRARSV